MAKRKRKYNEEHGVEQSSALHHGTVHEGPAHVFEQKGKNEPGEQEALTRKKRIVGEAGQPDHHQATETAVDSSKEKVLVCIADGVRNEGEQRVGAMGQKVRMDMEMTKCCSSFPVHDGVAVLSHVAEKKKKKKKKKMVMKEEVQEKEQADKEVWDSLSVDLAKDGMHSKDEEDDMLFNFGTQPRVNSIEHRGPPENNNKSEQKVETFLRADEVPRRKKKKKKIGEETNKCLSSDHHQDTAEDNVVVNFATITPPVVANTADYRSPEVVNEHASGSFGKEKQEVFREHKVSKEHEKKEMTMDEGQTPEKTRCERNSSDLPNRPTFSLAVAGSIVDNAQSLELATMLAGQIARAATIFRVDEIIVFDDYDSTSSSNFLATMQETNCEEVGGLFMVRILEYLEVPQYLRRVLIPVHRSLGSVGSLPPLDAPHHLRKHEWHPFREGVILDKMPLSGFGSCVDVGLEKEVVVSQKVKPRTRVTIAMGHTKADGNVLQVVDRETARQAGFYWGYSVRYASCFSAVFDECPFEGKYDFCIGTSEHGEKPGPTELVIPKCKHLLVAFGGLSGLEESVEMDERLQNQNVTSLFDRYINTCPSQGSRTIRTEEAILISLQFLQAAVQQALSAP